MSILAILQALCIPIKTNAKAVCVLSALSVVLSGLGVGNLEGILRMNDIFVVLNAALLVKWCGKSKRVPTDSYLRNGANVKINKYYFQI